MINYSFSWPWQFLENRCQSKQSTAPWNNILNPHFGWSFVVARISSVTRIGQIWAYSVWHLVHNPSSFLLCNGYRMNYFSQRQAWRTGRRTTYSYQRFSATHIGLKWRLTTFAQEYVTCAITSGIIEALSLYRSGEAEQTRIDLVDSVDGRMCFYTVRYFETDCQFCSHAFPFYHWCEGLLLATLVNPVVLGFKGCRSNVGRQINKVASFKFMFSYSITCSWSSVMLSRPVWSFHGLCHGFRFW